MNTIEMTCEEVKSQKYQTRKSPPFHAGECRNIIKKGKDGEYLSKPDAKGIYKWVKVSKDKRTEKYKGEPSEDPNSLKIETIRKGQNKWWWVQEDRNSGHVWELLRYLTKKGYTRKQKKVKGPARESAERVGQITVKYNIAETCDLVSTKKSCVFPACASKGEWTHVYNEGLPDGQDVKYIKKDIYTGNLEDMEEFKKQIQEHYNKYKKMGHISEFEIIDMSMKEHYQKEGRW